VTTKAAARPASKARPKSKTKTKTAKPTDVAPKKPAPRADLGAPVGGFFARQPPPLRGILDDLRGLIGETAPDATSAIKWGMPFFTIGGETFCALAAFKAHVNLILPGPSGTYPDPAGLLEGDGKTGKHLKLRPGDDFPRQAIRGWLQISAKRARG